MKLPAGSKALLSPPLSILSLLSGAAPLGM